MNDTIRNQLSAFIDGELAENESELLLRRLIQDAALRQQAADFLQIGRLIRGDRELPGMGQLRARVAANLAGEVLPDAPVETVSPARFMRPVAGVAIAASVAIVALIGLRQVSIVDDADLAARSTEFAAVAIDDSSMYTEQLSNEFVVEEPSDRVTQYLRHHEERSAGMGANILTRLVTLELREGELVEIEPRRNEEEANSTSVDDAVSESPAAATN